jgi:hypothetical protein
MSGAGDPEQRSQLLQFLLRGTTTVANQFDWVRRFFADALVEITVDSY